MVKHYSSMVAVEEIPDPEEGDTATTDEPGRLSRCWRYQHGRWKLLGRWTKSLSIQLVKACDTVVIVQEPE